MAGWLCMMNIGRKKIIDQEELQFDKSYGWNLIGIPEEPDGSLSDHEYFCIHDDLFDIIQSTDQEKNISMKIISNKPNENDSQCDATETCDDKIYNKNSTFRKHKPSHTLQRNRHKISVDYRKK